MAELQWDKIGERYYYAGLDRGVFYAKNYNPAEPDENLGVAWNGLVSVTPKAASGSVFEQYWFGSKLYDMPPPGNFSGTIEAYSSPIEADEYFGMAEDYEGFVFMDQTPKYFDMSFRTYIHSDTEERQHYQIHLLYNIMAIPVPMSYSTINSDPNATPLKWNFTSKMTNFDGPVVQVGNFMPEQFGRIILDTRKLPEDLIRSAEDVLYGTCTSEPEFLTPERLRDEFDAAQWPKGYMPWV